MMKHEANIQPQDPESYLRAGRRYQAEFHAKFFRAIARGIVILLGGFVKWMARPVVRWWRRRQSLDDLARLDDRTLKDIALTRGEFRSVAEYYAHGEFYPRDTKIPRSERRGDW